MKIRIKESQLDRLKTRLKEDAGPNTYSKPVKASYSTHNLFINGKEVNSVSSDPLKLSFMIEVDSREWGIKSILLYNIQGPSEVELDILFMDDTSLAAKLVLDWGQLKTETNRENSLVSVGDEIEIYLAIQDGKLVASAMTMEVYSL